MKICAIICEYNPLHYGHLYHIQKAKELSGCDAVMCIQAGNFRAYIVSEMLYKLHLDWLGSLNPMTY